MCMHLKPPSRILRVSSILQAVLVALGKDLQAIARKGKKQQKEIPGSMYV